MDTNLRYNNRARSFNININNRDMKYSKLFSKREKCYMYGNHVFVSNIRKKHSFIIETFEDYCKKCWEHKERLRLVPYHSDEI